MSAGPVLGFECEWYDNISGQLTKLFLKFFLDDNTIEILTEGTRCLLKRIFYAEVTARDLFVGNSITVFNRLMVIKAYCNEATVRYMGAREEHYLVVVPLSAGPAGLGHVLNIAKTFALKLGKARTLTSELPGSFDVPAPLGSTLFEFVGYDKAASQDFVRAVTARHSPWAAVVTIPFVAELFQLMRASNMYTPLRQCALCLVKPHVIRDGRLGDLLQAVASAGFSVDCLYLVHLTIPMATELFDVYKVGVVLHLCARDADHPIISSHLQF